MRIFKFDLWPDGFISFGQHSLFCSDFPIHPNNCFPALILLFQNVIFNEVCFNVFFFLTLPSTDQFYFHQLNPFFVCECPNTFPLTAAVSFECFSMAFYFGYLSNISSFFGCQSAIEREGEREKKENQLNIE